MSEGARIPNAAQQKTILKRVLKQGQFYICGVCRKGFPNYALANECLVACMDKLDKNLRVIVKINPQTKQQGFFCPLCRRGYTNDNAAQTCLKNCKAKSVESFQATPSANTNQNAGAGSSSTAPSTNPSTPAATNNLAPKPNNDGANAQSAAKGVIELLDLKNEQGPDQEKYIRDGAKYICRRCRKNYYSREEVISCYDLPCTTTGEKPKAEKIEKPGALTYKIEPGAKKPDPTAQKFIRDGARYVCRSCSARYFGREEVEACFDSHAAAGAPSASGNNSAPSGQQGNSGNK